MVYISANNVSASYRTIESAGPISLFGSTHRKLKALNGIDLEIGPDSRVGVIGPNGSGKSTLLKVLCGALPHCEGRLLVEGDTLSLLNRNAGLIPSASLTENAYIKGASLSLTGIRLRNFVHDSIAAANLEHRKKNPLKSLSTGLSGRFNLAINARVIRPIMILDEWVGTLDMAQIGQQGLLGRLTGEAKIVILASHNQALIERLCNKIVLLNEGKIIYQGDDLHHAFVELDSLKSISPSSPLLNRTNDSEYPQALHFLHRGKTGGYLIKKLLHNVRSQAYEFYLHGVHTTLRDIPAGEKVILFLRDPIERFCRAFNNRRAKGGPFYSTAWSPAEERVFAKYKNANALAEGLGSSDKVEQASAFRAMSAINFVDSALEDHLGDRDYINTRRDDIAFAGNSDDIINESRLMLEQFDLPANLVDELDQTTREYFISSFSDELSENAKQNLSVYYKEEKLYLAEIKELFFGNRLIHK